MKKTEFAKHIGISQTTLAKLSSNKLVSMSVIVNICRALDCSIYEMMDILPESEDHK